MSLKIKKTKTMEVSDWDAFVQETYKRPYSFQQQDGCKERGTFQFSEDFADSTLPEIVNHDKMGVSFAAWLARDPKKPLSTSKDKWMINLWWERNFYPNVQMIANDLHSKGLLKAGEYTIVIDW